MQVIDRKRRYGAAAFELATYIDSRTNARTTYEYVIWPSQWDRDAVELGIRVANRLQVENGDHGWPNA